MSINLICTTRSGGKQVAYSTYVKEIHNYYLKFQPFFFCFLENLAGLGTHRLNVYEFNLGFPVKILSINIVNFYLKKTNSETM